MTDTTMTTEKLECLDDHGDGECKGAVEYRMSLSPSGKPFPRCDRHWEKRLDFQEKHNRDYPDSPVAPSWFDPSYAGERWNDDY